MSGQKLTAEQVREQVASRFATINQSSPAYHKDLIAQSAAAYEKRWKTKMPAAKMATLKNSITHMEEHLCKRGFTREQIASAVSDLSKLDNPITMLFSLMSIVIPNFAYTDVIGIQPMPTKKSPVYFPEIIANETRNGVAKGTKLLGATNWNTKNTYSTNRQIINGKDSVTEKTVSYTAAEGNITKGTFVAAFVIGGISYYVKDDGAGHIPASEINKAGTIDYATGKAIFELEAALGEADTVVYSYRYEFAEGTAPAQITLKWTDKLIQADPYKLRSTYDLDDMYQAKQVLSGYDIDGVLSTTLSGYINKEISGNVFDDLLPNCDASYTWTKTLPTGVAWALHRLSIIQTYVEAGNGIRQNIGRAGGNVVVAGTDHMNIIETLGEDLWKPENYSAEPIGPYKAGKLANRFDVIKNQDYPTAKAVMVYKRDDVDASVIGGSFISLYSTPPLALDTLNVVQGMGCQMGYEKVVDNSIVELNIA